MYTIIYSLTTVTIFIILMIFSSYKNKEIIYIEQLSGLFHINPYLSFAFVLCVFSLAGIPPLFGFYAKFLVIYGYIKNNLFIVAIIAILTSVISCARYLTLIKEAQFTFIPLHSPIKKFNVPSILSYFISILITILLFGM
jgi:NADH-ubiquinone oxidoreductase chain 2